jgi:glycerol-3-phosphate dehydrogenase
MTSEVSHTEFDVIVIGAGINGAGIARDASMRGLRVLLLDKGDIGGGTSSYSTRLIHGGLRYLEHGELRLVRESLAKDPACCASHRTLLDLYSCWYRSMNRLDVGPGPFARD